MCKVLGVSKSGYYWWLKKKPSKRSLENKDIIMQIKHIYKQSNETYGSPRITKALIRRGLCISRPRVARLMRKEQIKSIVKKKYIITTDSKHDYKAAPNLVNRKFTVHKPGKVWVSDITYVKVSSKWLYLTVVIDLCDRKVIGWSLSSDMYTENTTVKALKMALLNRRKEPDLIFHSDRGIQYACDAFRHLLRVNNITQSMSRKGNCWDNAVAESFFKTLKVECTNRYRFLSVLEAKTTIFQYVEGWYNRERIHSSIDYTSPMEKSKQTLKLVA